MRRFGVRRRGDDRSLAGRSRRRAAGRPWLIFLTFAVLIAVGATVLSLPFSARGGYTRPDHALFVATSAVTVTGLTPLDLAVHFTPFGQAVVLLLIQVGGVGFVSFSVLLFALQGRDPGLGQRLLLRESLGSDAIGGVLGLGLRVLRVTLVVEAIGAALLALRWVPEYGLAQGLWAALFQSISSFCNNGLDVLGTPDRPFVGLAEYRGDVYVNLVISTLVILGGFSFPVLGELWRYPRTRRLSVYARLILVVNACLLAGGTLSYAVLEWSNPRTLGPDPWWEKLLSSYFGTTVLRTGGVAMLPYSQMAVTTQIISILLMFIGASSESTGGGVKTNTVGLLMAAVWDTLRGREKIHVFARRIPPETIYKAMTVVVVSACVVGGVSLALSLTEGGAFTPLIWETVSAFSTVGLSLDFTQRLTTPGLLLIALTMYWGRLGPLSLIAALVAREEPEPITYPVERIPIG